ncbi:MAG: TIGR01777 family protein [Oligoflexia bacterium]|nr:TIGR01777 family protein [Oligoflexia bacterium]MBF0366829.1 TIGR01777 family protein [Oligoflexia bacterium]
MKIAVTGATGTIGKMLVQELWGSDHERYQLLLFSRNLDQAKKIYHNLGISAGAIGIQDEHLQFEKWIPGDHYHLFHALNRFSPDVVIHLMGENIAEGSWKTAKKQAILRSRVDSGIELYRAIKSLTKRPSLFVQASAIGIYANGTACDICEENERECRSNSSNGNGATGSGSGPSFLAYVVRSWEEATAELERLGVKRVIARFAPVLSMDGGFLVKLVPYFKWCLGVVLGPEKGGLSWIHHQDAVSALIYLIEHKELPGGIYNFTSPKPTTNAYFFQTLAKRLHRPLWPFTFNFCLKLLMGQKGRELIMTDKRVIPQKLLDLGFIFKYPTIEQAIVDLIKRKEKSV